MIGKVGVEESLHIDTFEIVLVVTARLVSLLEHSIVQRHFPFGHSVDGLVNGARGNESEHVHRVLLANSMRSVFRLAIVLRIEANVEKHD